MNVWIADEELKQRLRGVVEPLEIRDASGQVLGHYTPTVSPEVAAAYEKAKSLFDPARTKRLLEEQQGQGRSLEEVWRRIKAAEIRDEVHGGMAPDR